MLWCSQWRAAIHSNADNRSLIPARRRSELLLLRRVLCLSIVRPVNGVKTFLVREIVTSLIAAAFSLSRLLSRYSFISLKQSLSMAQIEEASFALRCSLVLLVFIAE